MMKKMIIALLLLGSFSLHAADTKAVPDWVDRNVCKLIWESGKGYIKDSNGGAAGRKAGYEQAISHTKDSLRAMINDVERSFHFVPQWRWIYISGINKYMPQVAYYGLNAASHFRAGGKLAWMHNDSQMKELLERTKKLLDTLTEEKMIEPEKFMDDLYALACRTFAFVLKKVVVETVEFIGDTGFSEKRRRYATPIMQRYGFQIDKGAGVENDKHISQLTTTFMASDPFIALTLI